MLDGRFGLIQCKNNPGKEQTHQHRQVEPPRPGVVERSAGVAAKLLHAKQVAKKIRVLPLRQHKPRQGDHGKQRQAAGPGQAQHLGQLARPQQPHQQYQAGQGQANQPFGKHAQRARHKAQARQCGMGTRAMQKGQREGPDGHAYPGGHQHVVVDVLPCRQKRQTGAQHQRRAPGHGGRAHLLRRQINGHHHQPRVQGRHQPRRPGAHAKDRKGQRLHPVQQGWFVEEGNAVEPRRQPVARDQHPAADFGIAPFVGNGQRAQRCQHQQQRPQRAHHQPGFFVLGHTESAVNNRWPRARRTPASASACANAALAK